MRTIATATELATAPTRTMCSHEGTSRKTDASRRPSERGLVAAVSGLSAYSNGATGRPANAARTMLRIWYGAMKTRDVVSARAVGSPVARQNVSSWTRSNTLATKKTRMSVLSWASVATGTMNWPVQIEAGISAVHTRTSKVRMGCNIAAMACMRVTRGSDVSGSAMD